MEVRVLLPELLAVPNGWSLQTPEKRLVLHELARLVTPVVKRTITRASEARGLGSTPGWGNVTYGLAAASRGVAGWMSLGAACCAANLPACDSGVAASLRPPVSSILGVCRPAHDRAKVEDQVQFLARILRGTSDHVPHAYASGARVAAHRTRNAARVSSSLTAGSVCPKKCLELSGAQNSCTF